MNFIFKQTLLTKFIQMIFQFLNTQCTDEKLSFSSKTSISICQILRYDSSLEKFDLKLLYTAKLCFFFTKLLQNLNKICQSLKS